MVHREISNFEVIIWSPGFNLTQDFNAQLSDSVPPEVKKISFGLAFMQSAIDFLDFSSTFFENLPIEYKLEGFPKCSSKKGFIDSKTSGITLVVAALSAYIIFNSTPNNHIKNITCILPRANFISRG